MAAAAPSGPSPSPITTVEGLVRFLKEETSTLTEGEQDWNSVEEFFEKSKASTCSSDLIIRALSSGRVKRDDDAEDIEAALTCILPGQLLREGKHGSLLKLAQEERIDLETFYAARELMPIAPLLTGISVASSELQEFVDKRMADGWPGHRTAYCDLWRDKQLEGKHMLEQEMNKHLKLGSIEFFAQALPDYWKGYRELINNGHPFMRMLIDLAAFRDEKGRNWVDYCGENAVGRDFLLRIHRFGRQIMYIKPELFQPRMRSLKEMCVDTVDRDEDLEYYVSNDGGEDDVGDSEDGDEGFYLPPHLVV